MDAVPRLQTCESGLLYGRRHTLHLNRVTLALALTFGANHFRFLAAIRAPLPARVGDGACPPCDELPSSPDELPSWSSARTGHGWLASPDGPSEPRSACAPSRG